MPRKRSPRAPTEQSFSWQLAPLERRRLLAGDVGHGLDNTLLVGETAEEFDRGIDLTPEVETRLDQHSHQLSQDTLAQSDAESFGALTESTPNINGIANDGLDLELAIEVPHVSVATLGSGGAPVALQQADFQDDGPIQIEEGLEGLMPSRASGGSVGEPFVEVDELETDLSGISNDRPQTAQLLNDGVFSALVDGRDAARVIVRGSLPQQSVSVDGVDVTIEIADVEDWYRFSLNQDIATSIAVRAENDGSAEVDLFDVDSEGRSTRLAVGSSADNLDSVISDFVNRKGDGDFYARVTGHGHYTMTVVRDISLDSVSAQAGPQDITFTGSVLSQLGETQTIFAQDFENGLDESLERLFGNFEETKESQLLASGAIGHSANYGNDEYSYYEVNVDLSGVESAQLAFDYAAQISANFAEADGFNVLASKGDITPPDGLLNPTEESQLKYTAAGIFLEPKELTAAYNSNELEAGRAIFDLTEFAGAEATIRLQFASNGEGVNKGINIDNFSITGKTSHEFRVKVTEDESSELRIETFVLGMRADSVPVGLELRNANGVVIATSATGSLTQPLGDVFSDSYTIRLTAGNDGVSEVALFVAGQSRDSTGFRVVAATPADGRELSSPPSHVTLLFNDALDLESLSAEDLQINGAPASEFEILDANSVRFSVDPLPDGEHLVKIDQGKIQDAQGTDLDEFVSRFQIETTMLPDLVAVAPFGSLVYSTTSSGILDSVQQTANFDVIVDYLQTMTAFVEPEDPFFLPTVSLSGSGTRSIAVANGRGQTTFVQAVPSRGADVSLIAPIGERLYFAADDGESGFELFRYDTLNGRTELVSDIRPGPLSSSPAELAVFNDALYFSANDGERGAELYRFDPRTNRVSRVDDTWTGSKGSFPTGLTVFEDQLYFAADNGTSGRELFRYDANTETVRLVADIRDGVAGSEPSSMTPFNGKLFFSANDGKTGFELWQTDGTENGTNRVVDINPGILDSFPTELTVFRDTLYFSAVGSGVGGESIGFELYKYNPLINAAPVPKDINPGTSSSAPAAFTVLNDELYFVADGGAAGAELWKTDGTGVGSEMIADIYEGIGSSSPTALTVLNDRLYFQAFHPDSGSELHEFDPELNSFRLAADLGDGIASSFPGGLTAVNQTLFFTANSGSSIDLYSLDPFTELVTGINADGPSPLSGFRPSDHFMLSVTGVEETRRDFPGLGGFEINVLLNAAVEEEEYGGETNDQRHNAQDFNRSFTSLGLGDGQRLAVSGTADTPFRLTETRFGEFEQGPIPFGFVPKDAGLVEFPDASGDVSLTLKAALHPEATVNDPFVRLGGNSGSSNPLLRPDNSTHEGPVRTWTWDLDTEMLRSMLHEGHYLLSLVPSESRGPDVPGPNVLDELLISAMTFELVYDRSDFYKLDLRDGEIMSVTATSLQDDTTPLRLKLYDEEGNLLQEGTNAANVDQAISDYADVTNDGQRQTYFVELQGSGDYNLLITKNTSFEIVSPATDGRQNISTTLSVLGSFQEELASGTSPRDEFELDIPGVLMGDFDKDGSVAFVDFLVLSSNFGQTIEGNLKGDIDADGTVGFADLLILSSNFGKSAASDSLLTIQAIRPGSPESTVGSVTLLRGTDTIEVERNSGTGPQSYRVADGATYTIRLEPSLAEFANAEYLLHVSLGDRLTNRPSGQAADTPARPIQADSPPVEHLEARLDAPVDIEANDNFGDANISVAAAPTFAQEDTPRLHAIDPTVDLRDTELLPGRELRAHGSLESQGDKVTFVVDLVEPNALLDQDLLVTVGLKVVEGGEPPNPLHLRVLRNNEDVVAAFENAPDRFQLFTTPGEYSFEISNGSGDELNYEFAVLTQPAPALQPTSVRDGEIPAIAVLGDEPIQVTGDLHGRPGTFGVFLPATTVLEFSSPEGANSIRDLGIQLAEAGRRLSFSEKMDTVPLSTDGQRFAFALPGNQFYFFKIPEVAAGASSRPYEFFMQRSDVKDDGSTVIRIPPGGEWAIDGSVDQTEPTHLYQVVLEPNTNLRIDLPEIASVYSCADNDPNGECSELKDDLIKNEQSSVEEKVFISVSMGDGDYTLSLKRTDTLRTGTATLSIESAVPASGSQMSFDGDAVADVILADFVSDTVSIQVGEGAGSFSEVTLINNHPDVPWGPIDFVVDDFNGDQTLDVAVAGFRSNDIRVYLGVDQLLSLESLLSEDHRVCLGQDDCGPMNELDVPTDSQRPIAMVAGLFNDDLHLDLAVANFGSNDVSILLGHGDGTFRKTMPIQVGDGPIALSVGDFNMDDRADLVVANLKSEDVSVLLGSNDGDFPIEMRQRINTRPIDVHVISETNEIIVVTAGKQLPLRSDVFRIDFNEGQIGLDPESLLGNPDNAYLVLGLADVDKDNVLDLVGQVSESGQVVVVPGRLAQAPGGKQFELSVSAGAFSDTFLPSSQPRLFRDLSEIPIEKRNRPRIVLGDLDGDAIPDLVAVNVQQQSLLPRRGQGDGEFTLFGVVPRFLPSAPDLSQTPQITSPSLGFVRSDATVTLQVTPPPKVTVEQVVGLAGSGATGGTSTEPSSVEVPDLPTPELEIELDAVTEAEFSAEVAAIELELPDQTPPEVGNFDLPAPAPANASGAAENPITNPTDRGTSVDPDGDKPVSKNDSDNPTNENSVENPITGSGGADGSGGDTANENPGPNWYGWAAGFGGAALLAGTAWIFRGKLPPWRRRRTSA